MCGHQRHDGIVEDFCDTVHAKAHPIFGRDKTALQLLLFYDELEVCNPIGSSRKKHKIGICKCFYLIVLLCQMLNYACKYEPYNKN